MAINYKHKLLIYLFLALLLSSKMGICQKLDIDMVLQKAVRYRQTQNAANDILWGASHNVMENTWLVDQDKGLMIVERGTSVISCKIKIIGTYDHKDSTFLWSVYNKSINPALTSPVGSFANISDKNNWGLFTTRSFKCSFEKAYELATLAFYFDTANGLAHKMTNNGRTNVIYTYYEIEIKDRMYKAFNKTIPVKKQFEEVAAPDLIEICKRYLTNFDSSERKYAQLFKNSNRDSKYMDTMFVNRIKISDVYWDTTSIAYPFHRKNRIQPSDLNRISNWRAVTIGDNTQYVLYDEKKTWDSYCTWAFEFKKTNGKYLIENEFMCL